MNNSSCGYRGVHEPTVIFATLWVAFFQCVAPLQGNDDSALIRYAKCRIMRTATLPQCWREVLTAVLSSDSISSSRQQFHNGLFIKLAKCSTNSTSFVLFALIRYIFCGRFWTGTDAVQALITGVVSKMRDAVVMYSLYTWQVRETAVLQRCLVTVGWGGKIMQHQITWWCKCWTESLEVPGPSPILNHGRK